MRGEEGGGCGGRRDDRLSGTSCVWPWWSSGGKACDWWVVRGCGGGGQRWTISGCWARAGGGALGSADPSLKYREVMGLYRFSATTEFRFLLWEGLDATNFPLNRNKKMWRMT